MKTGLASSEIVFLLILPVVRSGYSQEPLHSYGDNYEDTAAETESVQRVVEVGKYWEKSVRVELVMIVPHYIKDSKHQVERIEDVEGNKEIVETDLLLQLSRG